MNPQSNGDHPADKEHWLAPDGSAYHIQIPPDDRPALVPTTFIIYNSQVPAQRFDNCLAFYEMRNIGQAL